MIRFFKLKGLMQERISLSLSQLQTKYHFLSRGEVELLYVKIQTIKNQNFKFNTIERRFVKKMVEKKEEKKESVKTLPKKNAKAPNRYDENTKRKVLSVYNSEGKSVKTIAKETGIGHKAICRWLRKAGITNINNKH